jgi:hypothetical protein
MNSVRLNENLVKSLGSVIRMSSAEMIAKTGIPCTTWYNIMKKPAVITVQQLLAISNGLQIPASRFFSTDKADFIDKYEDYITEPYLPCRYEDSVLQELVSKRHDASWQKAADLAGMSRTRMRNSLLAVTRTPVVRFLDVCKVFDIDPFTVLVDPNPKTKRKRKAANPVSSGTSSPTLLAEIADLRKDVTNLTATAADITAKYQDLEGKYGDILLKYTNLLEAHKMLLSRFNDHLEESYIGMAADGGSDK